MNNGGTYTVVNSRPLKRDSVGRIYEERWLLSPKGSNIPSQMSWIQIGDPVTHTLYQCNVRAKGMRAIDAAAPSSDRAVRSDAAQVRAAER